MHGFAGSRVRGFTGSRVRGFTGSRVRGFAGSRVPAGSRVRGFAGSRVRGCAGSRVRGCTDSRVRGFTGSRVRGFAGSRVRGFAGSQVHGFAGSRVRGSTGSRVHGFAGSQVRRFAGSRVRGFAGSRVRGLAGSRVRGFAAFAGLRAAPCGYKARRRVLCLQGMKTFFLRSGQHMLFQHNYGLGMDALLTVCSRNTNGSMVWAWMLWSPYALPTRTEVWFGHGCSCQRMLFQHERKYGLGIDALVIVCSPRDPKKTFKILGQNPLRIPGRIQNK